MNIEFLIVGAFFLVIAALFIRVLPRMWQRSIKGESVIDWFKIRQRELASESEDLLEEAELRVVEELGPTRDTPLTLRPAATKAHAWLLLLSGVVASVWLYGHLGAQADVDISDRLANLRDATPTEVQALVGSIERRVESRSENVDYLSLLGEYYTASEQSDKAFKVYEQLLALMPENPDVLARAAQSEFLANGRQLSTRAERRALAALAAAPNQRAALGTLAMAASEGQNYREAIRYWARLAQLEQPGSSDREMIDRILATARDRADMPVAAAAELPRASTEVESLDIISELGVSVTISVAPDLQIPPSAAVFVLARPAGSTQRMPVAVQRLDAADLPATIRLDDGNSMAGQKVSTLQALDIEVQVSPSGQPGLRNAAWVANATNIVPSVNAAIMLTLTR